MRKVIVLGVLVAVICGLAPVASAASSIATCLISDGGRYTKSLICVELVDNGDGQAGSGSYAPGDDTANWLTVTVEFQPLGRPSVWLPLAATRTHGTGVLRATTPPVRLPSPGVLRACTLAGTGTDATIRRLCSVSGQG